ncbi:MAG: efflux RND transporter periplasmic adaptor subunit [Hyphomicrobiaceae bacterium]
MSDVPPPRDAPPAESAEAAHAPRKRAARSISVAATAFAVLAAVAICGSAIVLAVGSNAQTAAQALELLASGQRLIENGFKKLFAATPERVSVPNPGTAASGQKGNQPLPSVTVSRPLAREIVEWDEYTGRFEAVETVDVRARVSGYLMKVHFTDGQMVKKGDLLFTIDARSFERVLDQVQAELAQARTRAENAAKEVDRGRPLVERRIMSEKVFDDRAALQRDAEAAIKVAEAKVKTAELELSFTSIASPVDGRIGRANVSVGNWVSAGGSNTTTILTTIVSQDPIYVYFDVSENNWIKYKRIAERTGNAAAAGVGTPVRLALPDEKSFPHQGRLDFIDNRFDQGTGTLRARAVVENKAGLFSSGMFVRVRMTGSPKYPALLLPDEAIGTDQTIKFVYTVGEDGTVTRKTIVPGSLIDGLRVVRDGLTAEDWIVVKGLQRARPGLKVAPKREPIKVSLGEQ